MAENIEPLLRQIADLRRQVSNMMVSGPVKEVKGDKIRVIVGKDMQGQDVLSPWLNTTNHRGGARERKFFKQGQNVTIFSPAGDMLQSVVTPYAPNNDFKAPDHANETGQDEETYQQEYHRSRDLPNGQETYLAAKKDAKDSKDAKVMVRMGEENPKKDAEPKGEYTVNASEKIVFKVDDSNRIEISSAGVKIYGKRIDWNP